MNIEEMLIKPKTLSLLTTYKCTSSCKNCCFGCNPKIDARLDVNEMKHYIDITLKSYKDSLKVLVLTGGECFLLGNELDEIISYAKENDLMVRVVTNGYWAKSYDETYERLKTLINLGLSEINFSTGDDHLEWTPYENIVNGCVASVELGIMCVVNVERHDKSEFTAKRFFEDTRLKEIMNDESKRNLLKIESGIWISFNNEDSLTYNNIPIYDSNVQGCTALFNTIAINPYSEIIACCGLTSEYIKCMRLGNLRKDNISIKEVWENQFYDFIKIWLFTEGPLKILNFIQEKKGSNHNYSNRHICDICSEIFKSQQNINILQNCYKEVLPTIILKYLLLRESINK